MARVIAAMTMPLDGFVADRSGSASRLYPDLAELRDTAYMNAKGFRCSSSPAATRVSVQLRAPDEPLETSASRPTPH
jgi:hypothetical protein